MVAAGVSRRFGLAQGKIRQDGRTKMDACAHSKRASAYSNGAHSVSGALLRTSSVSGAFWAVYLSCA
jgi:hypothetical protein